LNEVFDALLVGKGSELLASTKITGIKKRLTEDAELSATPIGTAAWLSGLQIRLNDSRLCWFDRQTRREYNRHMLKG